MGEEGNGDMDATPEQRAPRCEGGCDQSCRRVAELERELALLRGAVAMATATLKVAAPGVQ